MALPARAGLTFHPALVGSILRAPPGFVEFVAEGLTTTAQRRQARALREMVPVSVHGVSLSLGSAEGIDDRRLRALRDAAVAVDAVAVSEHLAFVRAGGREIGHLTPLPFTRAAIDVVAANVARARAVLPQLWLENVWSPLPPHRLPDEMDEPAFLSAIVARTGCGLLLDVANLVANAKNRGVAPLSWLDRLPLQAVQQLHIAGSADDDSGFVIDTHADAVAEDVFAFAAAVIDRTGPLPICLERDRDVDVDEVEADLARVDGIAAGRAARPDVAAAAAAADAVAGVVADVDGAGGSDVAALAAWQRALAAALSAEVDDAVADVDLARARGILARKRDERRPASRPRRSWRTTLSSLFGALS